MSEQDFIEWAKRPHKNPRGEVKVLNDESIRSYRRFLNNTWKEKIIPRLQKDVVRGIKNNKKTKESEKIQLINEANDAVVNIKNMDESAIFDMTADSADLKYLVETVVPLLRNIEVGNNICNAINNYYASLNGSEAVVDDDMASFIDFPELIKSAQYRAPDPTTGDGGRQPQNLIFHGAPGTGKTYNVLKTVAELVSEEHKEGADEGTDALPSLEKSNLEPLGWLNTNASRYFSMVQFHPSYDYTDFVEGLRPYTAEGGNVGFRLEPGVFMKLCGRARADAAHHYYMVIDEINRGDISKIFGELFFLLDPGYRGEGIETQYANMHPENWKHVQDGVQYLQDDGTFSIPTNVTIIGTMNDIDRSVDSLDFAMRRRFRFVNIDDEASWALLMGGAAENEYPSSEAAHSVMEAINKVIADDHSEELGPDYVLGATYFRGLAKTSKDKFDDEKSELWDNRIEPLLREYLRGTGVAIDDFSEAWDNSVGISADETGESVPEPDEENSNAE